jgi:hypothetical protein
MEKNLEANGIPDEAEEFTRLALDDNEAVPEIHVYFNDDLSEY